MNTKQSVLDFCKTYSLPISLTIILFIHNCNSLNRTKRTIGIFRAPHKLEAIGSYFSPKPDSVKTRFYLYTRRNAEKSQELTIGNEERLLQSFFNPKLPIKFVINGWLDNRYFAKWVRRGINSLLLHGDYNVIYVGWKSIQELFVAAFLIKFYSEDLAQFIIFLKNTYDINGETIHCIGHSLGSFLCGFAGALTYIGRLSALDAGPRAWYESMPELERVNRWQAGFVDVIHSDFNPLLSWALTIPVGDVDFFPNISPQPGCMRDKFIQGYKELRDEGLVVGIYQWARYMFFCSHYRSHEWFFESVWNKKCTFVGVRCPSYEMFMSGECGCDSSNDACAVMGFNADTPLNRAVLKKSDPGKWFMKTSDFVRETGYHCLFQYQIYIILGQLFPISNGTLLLTIQSDDDITQELLTPPNSLLYPGLRFGKLAVRPNLITTFKMVSISWTLNDNQDPYKELLSWITIEDVRVAPILIDQHRMYTINLFCSTRHQIKAQHTIQLISC